VRWIISEDVTKFFALLETSIDFGEGEDLKEGVYEQGSSLLDEPLIPLMQYPVIAVEKVQALIRTIESHLAGVRRGEIVRSEINLLIFGPLNAGKSSLLNFLCRCLTVVLLPPEVPSVRPKKLKGTQPSSPRFLGPQETSCPFHSMSEAFRSSSQIPQGPDGSRIWPRTSVPSVPTKHEFW
jgi:hypothetical protein